MHPFFTLSLVQRKELARTLAMTVLTDPNASTLPRGRKLEEFVDGLGLSFTPTDNADRAAFLRVRFKSFIPPIELLVARNIRSFFYQVVGYVCSHDTKQFMRDALFVKTVLPILVIEGLAIPHKKTFKLTERAMGRQNRGDNVSAFD